VKSLALVLKGWKMKKTFTKVSGGSRSSRYDARLSDEAFELIAARFRALGEPMRLKILHALGKTELSVGELVDATGAGQANVSKHLAVLLDSHMVARRKEGLNVFYRVADATVFDLCDTVCNSVGERLAAQHTAVKRFVRK
jgi:ArsR family transcriptional regulator